MEIEAPSGFGIQEVIKLHLDARYQNQEPEAGGQTPRIGNLKNLEQSSGLPGVQIDPMYPLLGYPPGYVSQGTVLVISMAISKNLAGLDSYCHPLRRSRE
jgi:hypothetical protein